MERDPRYAEPRRCGDFGAEEVDRIGELKRVAGTGPFGEHRSGHAGKSGFPLRVHQRTGPYDEVDLDKRHVVLLQEQDLYAVGKSEMPDRGEPKRRGWSQFRGAAPVRLGRNLTRVEKKRHCRDNDRSPADADQTPPW